MDITSLKEERLYYCKVNATQYNSTDVLLTK